MALPFYSERKKVYPECPSFLAGFLRWDKNDQANHSLHWAPKYVVSYREIAGRI